jgi:hypothetical protein
MIITFLAHKGRLPTEQPLPDPFCCPHDDAGLGFEAVVGFREISDPKDPPPIVERFFRVVHSHRPAAFQTVNLGVAVLKAEMIPISMKSPQFERWIQ